MANLPKSEMLRRRSKVLQTIREHFFDHGFVEIETPTRLCIPTLEDYIDAVPAGEGWLRTSPELHMKRLLADGMERIFQIGPCFRAGEHGLRHRSEFTMLEWYQANADYRDLLMFTQQMIVRAASAIQSSLDLAGEWEELTVDEAFQRYAGISVREAEEFEVTLVEQVEPKLGRGRPTFLLDYPSEHAALARLKSHDPRVAERWELYIDGLELANTYSELVDPEEQRQRFEATIALRAADGRDVYPIDEQFLAALGRLPSSAGSALGIDRLLMALTGVSDIADVVAFTEGLR